MINEFTHFINKRLTHFKKMIPLSITFFLYTFAWAIISPVFNIRINEVTNSLALSGIVISMFGLIRIFIDPFMGLLCDKVNPKKLLQTSIASYAIIFIAYTLANNFIELMIIRIVHGLIAAILWISGWTLVRLKSKGKHSQEELSAWVTFQDIASIIAPLIGGFIITNYTWKPAYYLAAIISLISFAYASIKIRKPIKRKNHVKGLKQQLKKFFKKPTAKRLTILTLTTYTILTAFGAFLPIHLKNKGLTIEEISIIFAIATTIPYLLFPILIGVLSDKYGRKTPTIIGLIIITIGFYAFTNINTFAQFFTYTLIIYTGASFITMSVNAELNDLLPVNQTGGYTGIYESIKDIGFTIGPLMMGLIASNNMNTAFITLAISSLASIIILKGFKDF